MRSSISAASASLLLLLCSCAGGLGDDADGGNKTPLSKLSLKAFAEDCEDFLAYAADALTEQYLTSYRCFGDGPCPMFAVDAEATSGGAGGAPAVRTPDRVSGTNTQEAGVDEADIVKADSDGRIYVLAGRSFVSLAAFPPAGLGSREPSTLDLSAVDASFYGQDFFLDEQRERAVILGSRYDDGGGEAVAVIVDVSDPEDLVELARLSVDGYGYNARRVGQRVHRISSYYVSPPSWFYDDADDQLQVRRSAYHEALARGDEAQAEEIKATVRTAIGERVATAGAEAFVPRLRYAATGQAPVESTLACNAISHPEVTTGLGLVLVDSFDTDGTDRALAGIINNAHIVYASSGNLYLAQSSWGWWFDREQAEETAVYRLALAASGPAVYRALGKVDGSLQGGYSLSEYEGHLRVATTERRRDGDTFTPYNHVTILRADQAGEMPRAGALRDLAPGETIQGVRYDGPRGYLVTFRNIDPLFALDLADAANPKVKDELKIPGFSSYLMPLGTAHLLTIGRAGNDTALNGKVGIQLFDVADISDIAQLAVIEPAAGDNGYSWSVAGYDPHAFAYFPDSADAATPGTLSIPLQAWSQDDWRQSFSGFLVVRVDPAAAQPLRELGRISHAQFAAAGGLCAGGTGNGPCRDAIHFTDPRRSVFMQDGGGTYLYTLSSMGLIASDAGQPAIQLGARSLPREWVCCQVEPADGG
jgi:hypothetical protein